VFLNIKIVFNPFTGYVYFNTWVQKIPGGIVDDVHFGEYIKYDFDFDFYPTCRNCPRRAV
jgi:hypothetical protein